MPIIGQTRIRGRHGGGLIAGRPLPAFADDYPDPAGHADHPVPARRQHHHRHPLGQRQARRGARPADRHRQSRRRRRHRRHARAREGRSRRLHHRARLHRHARDRPEPLFQRRLRSAQGLRRDRPDRHRAEHAGGASVVPGQDGSGVHRLRQGQPRQGQLRLGRHRHRQPRLRRIFRQRDRHQARARSLQGHRPGAERSDRRPHPGGLRADPGDLRERQGRHACACWR